LKKSKIACWKSLRKFRLSIAEWQGGEKCKILLAVFGKCIAGW